MINIEKISEHIFSAKYFENMDKKQKLMAQYGFSMILGILIEFIGISLIGYFLGIYSYIWPMMISSLIFKASIQGNHCSSYDRCAIFTGIFFLVPSFICKYVHMNLNKLIFLLLFSIICGFIILLKEKAYTTLRNYILIHLIILAIYIFNRNTIVFITSISLGCFLRIWSATKSGQTCITYCDNLMIKIKIS